MRSLSILCLAGSLFLFGCGQDCPSPNQSGGTNAANQSQSGTGSAGQEDIDASAPVTVDVSQIHDDNDLRSAIDTAWYTYTTEMQTVPSAYMTAAPKLQPFIEVLRAKDMKAYLAWMDAKETNNFEQQFKLEETVPALKEYKAAEAAIMKNEQAVEFAAQKAKRAVALRKYMLTVVALSKGYVAKDAKQ